MGLSLAWVALRRHPLSISTALGLLICTTSLLAAPVAIGLGTWLALGLIVLQVWSKCERRLARWAGARAPSRVEREGLAPFITAAAESPLGTCTVLVADAAEPWHVRGLRTIVISRGLLDLIGERSIRGLLTYAAAPAWSASVAAEFLVRLAMLPLGAAWLLDRALLQVGYLVAVLIGGALVLPLVLWSQGFVRWAGRLLGALLIGMLGIMLVGSGLPGAGGVVLVGFAAVPGVQALLGWEWRRTETLAEQFAIERGLGWELLEALETLTWLDDPLLPGGVLGWIARGGSPVATRAERVWKAVTRS